MSMLYMAQHEQQQVLDWLDGGTLRILLDSAATDGRLMMGRFDVARGEAPPEHKHLHEDEIFMLISGTALVWFDGERRELGEGGVVFLPRNVPHAYRITSERADLLMINTPGGIEGMFRAVGHDRSRPRPDGLEITPQPEVSERYGNIVLGPPR
jgi:quercetin dioxygenase-like cupin family protein